MIILYRLAIFLYQLLIRLVSLFKPKARQFIEGRKNLLLHIKVEQSSEKRPKIWMHCASLGEFEQGRPVLEALREKYPQYALVLTFFSPSGYQVQKKYKGADYVYYLPIDTAANARQFVRNIQPELALFVKYDLWYFYLQTLQEQKIPTILIDAIFRQGQIFFRAYGALHRKMLKSLSFIFVQNQESKDLLESIGVQQVAIAGDTRFDRVWSVAEKAKPLRELERLSGQYRFLVAGSTWEQDEQLLQKVIQHIPDDVRLIIAPHEVDASRIAYIEKLFPGNTIRWSACGEMASLDKQVLIVDTIGLLLKIYRYGYVAWIGGGLSSSGIHNVLEAAVYGLPTAFGNNYEKYQEAKELVSTGGAYPCVNSTAALLFFEHMFQGTEKYRRAQTAAQNYVQTKIGASKKIMDYLEEKNWLRMF